jgi:hypothetical protein
MTIHPAATTGKNSCRRPAIVIDVSQIEGSVFEDSPIGLSIWSGSGAVVSSNQFVRTPLEAINFASSGSGVPINGRLEGNSIEMLAAPGGLDWGWGLDIYGMAGPLSGTTVADNTITGGTGGIRLGLVWSTEVTRNSLSGSAFAALQSHRSQSDQSALVEQPRILWVWGVLHRPRGDFGR